MFGFYNVFKPAGPTSHDIVDLLRGRLGRQCKVGHAGTLDPFAEGVLVMAVGAATRLVDFIQAQPKAYRAEFTLGATSSTDDPTGEIQQSASAAGLGIERIDAALARFVGNVQQAPPAHSAVHIDGQRAYRLARAGHSVDPADPWGPHIPDRPGWSTPGRGLSWRFAAGRAHTSARSPAIWERPSAWAAIARPCSDQPSDLSA